MGNVWVKSGKTYNLLNEEGITVDATGEWVYKDSPDATFQAIVVGTGAVAANVSIEVSNDATYTVGTVAGTIALSGTTSDSDGFTTQNAPWKYVRANVTGISGTGATVKVIMGV